jgi:hypothetical protein
MATCGRTWRKGQLVVRCGTALAAGVAGATTVATGAQAAPPTNDSFAAAAELLGDFGHLRSSNVEATKEPGEPDHAGVLGNKSVWYSWTAPKDGKVAIETEPEFDSLLAVYDGESVDDLTTVAANDDRWSDWWGSRVTFRAVAGTSYAVAVDGVAGKSGDFVLGWAMRPSHDDFAAAQPITGESGTARTDTSLATRQDAEPRWHRRSVWYRWTAPSSGEVVLRTRVNLSYAFLGVYRGRSLDALRLVAPKRGHGFGYNRLRLDVRKGRTYRVMLGSYPYSTGPTALRWEMR